MLRFALGTVGAVVAFAGMRRALRREADLLGQVPIVTGGARGLGFAVHRTLATLPGMRALHVATSLGPAAARRLHEYPPTRPTP